MHFLYTLSIHIYILAIRIASLRSAKAKKWLEGRRELFGSLEEKMKRTTSGGIQKTVWFHCASLGEFEQGRPVMEKMKRDSPSIRIVLSFFSPSGFDIRKNYQGADVVTYLPADIPSKVEKFLDLVRPHAVVFIKYEFWYNFLRALKKRNIPHYLVSGIFRKDQPFFKWYGSWFRRALNGYEHIFVQDDVSSGLLTSIEVEKHTITGDTRFDRVSEIAERSDRNEKAAAFSAQARTIVCGSTWEKDEQILSEWMRSDHSFKLIIAPHVVNEEHLASISKTFAAFNPMRYSEFEKSRITSCRILIIDNTGMLSGLYRYGNFAYIGGGFGSGIHNILEAAVYGVPVIFGPNFGKFREAVELIEKGGAFTISSSEDLKQRMDFFLRDDMILRMASMVSKDYVRRKKGATALILGKLIIK